MLIFSGDTAHESDVTNLKIKPCIDGKVFPQANV